MTNPPIRYLTNIAAALHCPLETICEHEWIDWTVFDARAPKPPKPRDFIYQSDQWARRPTCELRAAPGLRVVMSLAGASSRSWPASRAPGIPETATFLVVAVLHGQSRLMTDFDVVVVGGGAAGLSAALVLSRARRRVLVVDSGMPRNAPASHMHGFLSRDGFSPSELLELGREEVAGYGGQIVDASVAGVESLTTGFRVALDSGLSVSARTAACRHRPSG